MTSIFVSAIVYHKVGVKKWLVPCVLVLAAMIVFKWRSFVGRFFIWDITLSNYQQYFLTGTGQNSFSFHYSEWQNAYFTAHQTWSLFHLIADCPAHPYNEFLKMFVEYGIGGVICLLLIFTSALLLYRQAQRSWKMVCYLGVITFLIFSLVYDPLSSNIGIATFAANILLLTMPRTNWMRLVWLLMLFVQLLQWWGQEVRLRYAQYDWDDAMLWAITDPQTAEDHFRSADPVLRTNPFFAESHAANLIALDTMRAIQYIHGNIHLNMYQASMLMGGIFESREQFDSAKKYFIHAHTIIPNRFVPLFELYKIAKSSSDTIEAMHIRKLIKSMPVKIPSNKIDYIKVRTDERF